MRFCVEYPTLIAVIVRGSSPLPRIEECIGCLGEVSVFTILEDNSGYWHIGIKEAHRSKTAFTRHHGLFHFVQMLFVLKNAPVTFQRAMDTI